MSEAAITVEGIGKRYRVGQRDQHAQTFREAVMSPALPS